MQEPATDEPRSEHVDGLVCPFLISAAGPWRSAEPTRDHRCSRLTHATHLDLVHQRRFCLGSGGPGCPHYVAARSPGRFVSTLPVVVDRGPMTATLEQEGIRRLAVPATVVIVGAALGALLLSRGPDAPGSTPGGPSLGTSAPSPAASSRPATAAPSPTPAPSAPIPSASPGPSASPPTTGGRTYTIRPGDTLGAIAAKLGTTTRVLVQLNGIKNPSLIHAGEVLKLP